MMCFRTACSSYPSFRTESLTTGKSNKHPSLAYLVLLLKNLLPIKPHSLWIKLSFLMVLLTNGSVKLRDMIFWEDGGTTRLLAPLVILHFRQGLFLWISLTLMSPRLISLDLLLWWALSSNGLRLVSYIKFDSTCYRTWTRTKLVLLVDVVLDSIFSCLLSKCVQSGRLKVNVWFLLTSNLPTTLFKEIYYGKLWDNARFFCLQK